MSRASLRPERTNAILAAGVILRILSIRARTVRRYAPESVRLVGGLTPRYLAPALRAGKVAHAGTGDVDIVIQLEMLAKTDAYRSLEENLKEMGFERAENEKGEKQSWRWKTKTEKGRRSSWS